MAVIVYAASNGAALVVPAAAVGTQGPPGPAGSGSTIGVKNEGSLISTTVQRVNFTGAGKAVSGTGADVTIDIPGGGGSSFIDPRDYGVLPANSGAANLSAWNAMMATLQAAAAASTYYRTLPKIRFTDDLTYNFSGTLEITEGSVEIEGVGPPTDGTGTTLQFPAGVVGIRTHTAITTGATTRAAGKGSEWSIFRNLRLIGGYAGTEGEYHGVQLRARARLENLFIAGFQGDGVYCNVAAGSGGSTEGNANSSHLAYCRIEQCRNGVYIDGADSNVWTTIGLDLGNNRRWGLWDGAFFGNFHYGVHAENNGYTTGTPATVVSYSSKWYAARKGGTWSNAPSGTTADTADWYYISAGGVNAGLNIPAWTSGGSFRDGGSYRGDAINGVARWDCYIEGTQIAQIDPPALVTGSIGPNLRGAPTYYSGAAGLTSSGGLVALGNLFSGGPQTDLGPQSGTALDLTLNLNNHNTTSTVNFKRAGVATDGTISSASTGLSYTGTNYHQFYIGGSGRTGYFDANGLNMDSGKFVDAALFRVAGTQVVGARGAAVADATNATDVITQLNALLARLRTHGLIAP